MAGIKRFEDLKVWQASRTLCKQIHALINTDRFKNDFALKDQIRRSSRSIMDNIAEGFGRGGTKEMVYFLFIAKASLYETKSQLYRALDCKYLKQENFDKLYQSCTQIEKMISSFIQYLKTSKHQNFKNQNPSSV